MLEEIKHQTIEGEEFQKGGEEIYESPRNYVPVPKVKKQQSKTVKQNGNEKQSNLDSER